MSCKIGNASNSVTLHLDVGAKHLANEGLEATQLDNEQLIIGYSALSAGRLLKAAVQTHYLRPNFRGQRWPPAAPLYHGWKGGKGWGRACRDQRDGLLSL